MKKVMNQLSVLWLMLVSAFAASAHEGIHAAGQAHMGESHMSLMEMSMLVAAIIALPFIVQHIRNNK